VQCQGRYPGLATLTDQAMSLIRLRVGRGLGRAVRLQGENALAGDDARRQGAIGDMLEQVARLDGLVAELLSMTQHRKATNPSGGRFLPVNPDRSARCPG
jgi:hypothetical protein